jgi:hypothetical protein
MSTSPDDSVETVIADFSNPGYSNSTYVNGKQVNRFSIGECTWYCCGRAYEKKGVALSPLLDSGANAGLWMSKIHPENSNGKVTTSDDGDTPVVDSIAVLSSHVIYIEAIRGSNIYFSECNWHKPLNDGNYDTTKGDGVLHKNTWEQITDKRGACNGFIIVR